MLQQNSTIHWELNTLTSQSMGVHLASIRTGRPCCTLSVSCPPLWLSFGPGVRPTGPIVVAVRVLPVQHAGVVHVCVTAAPPPACSFVSWKVWNVYGSNTPFRASLAGMSCHFARSESKCHRLYKTKNGVVMIQIPSRSPPRCRPSHGLSGA